MEVHAHTHPSTSSGHRKKWTHYFWEFLMLFLAVFSGFLAEYQLEHKIEKDRSRQLILSFYDDLHINLKTFERIIHINKRKIEAFNNIFFCYDSISLKIKNTTCLLNMIKGSQTFANVTFADGTLVQLKNAGGFRLLNKEDRDSIIYYDKLIDNYLNWESTGFQNTQNNVRDAVDMFGNFEINKALLSDTLSIHDVSVLLNADSNTVNRIFNVLARYKKYIGEQSARMNFFIKKSNSLINYFQEKYHYN